MILKKILCFLLPLFLLPACDGTIDPDVGTNPVVGKWNSYYKDTGNLIMTRVFTPDFYSYFIYAAGKNQNKMNQQHYTINETHIRLDQYTQAYTLDKDTLWITNSKGDQKTKYIRVQ